MPLKEKKSRKSYALGKMNKMAWANHSGLSLRQIVEFQTIRYYEGQRESQLLLFCQYFMVQYSSFCLFDNPKKKKTIKCQLSTLSQTIRYYEGQRESQLLLFCQYFMVQYLCLALACHLCWFNTLASILSKKRFENQLDFQFVLAIRDQ